MTTAIAEPIPDIVAAAEQVLRDAESDGPLFVSTYTTEPIKPLTEYDLRKTVEDLRRQVLEVSALPRDAFRFEFVRLGVAALCVASRTGMLTGMTR